MAQKELSIISSNSLKLNTVDYRIGAFILSKHLNLGESLASISVDKGYARQLLLKVDSEFKSGRVPLYVCECCADLGCGALTVRVEKIPGGYRWSDFGNEGVNSDAYGQTDYMKRTGPFEFEETEYRTALLPFA